jgi:hypothetical protein
LEKCFNCFFVRSTHGRSAFHEPETRQKPVFPRNPAVGAESGVKLTGPFCPFSAFTSLAVLC